MPVIDRCPPIESIGFMVNNRPIAVYGLGLRESTEQFIKGFDAGFWNHQLDLLSSVSKENPTHDHVSLARHTLAHAEEHLFSLVFAFLQAPRCPDLWLYRYKTEDLHELVEKVQSGKNIPTLFSLKSPNWGTIVQKLWPSLEEKRVKLTAAIFTQLAVRFCSGYRRDEYNGMKHGLRLSFGGHGISFSPAESPEVEPSPESFVSLGDSKFGCRIWSFEKIQGAKDHYRAKLRIANWDYDEICHYLAHVTLLIGNIGGAFRLFNEIEGDCGFRFFSGDASYEVNPRRVKGLISGELVANYNLEPKDLIDLEKIKSFYS